MILVQEYLIIEPIKEFFVEKNFLVPKLNVLHIDEGNFDKK